tara:strand:- start:1023 stop:2264 length:1242 start_codon:yes stop_codon:yes gene_type:complete
MKFISFGCWNKGDPDDPKYPLYHLVESLRNRLSEGDIDFVMITGDNYYYHNEKEKLKGYPFTEDMELENIRISLEGGAEKKDEKVNKDSCDLSLLEETFNRINEIGEMYDVPIYMCSGNHEYKPHTILNKHLLTVEISPPTDTVKDPGEDKENLLDYQKQLLKDSDTKYIEQGRLIIDGDRGEGGPVFYVINTEKGKLDMDFIEDEGDKHIYIFGHIPILSLNPKPSKGRIWDINDYLVAEFVEHGPNNITYICADTHNYQDIEIIFQSRKKVRQFVIGSGGTFKMDDLIEEKPTIVEDPKLKEGLPGKIKSINLNKASTGYHGFCVFDTETPLRGNPEFISFFPEDPYDKIIKLQMETARAVQRRNRTPGSSSLWPQSKAMKKKYKKRKSKHKSKSKRKKSKRKIKHKSKRK